MEMDTNSIWTVVITLITVLGSTSAFKFYSRRMHAKDKLKEFDKEDCHERIKKLETKLDETERDREHLRIQILTLTEEVAQLRVRVEFLTKP